MSSKKKIKINYSHILMTDLYNYLTNSHCKNFNTVHADSGKFRHVVCYGIFTLKCARTVETSCTFMADTDNLGYSKSTIK